MCGGFFFFFLKFSYAAGIIDRLLYGTIQPDDFPDTSILTMASSKILVTAILLNLLLRHWIVVPPYWIFYIVL